MRKSQKGRKCKKSFHETRPKSCIIDTVTVGGPRSWWSLLCALLQKFGKTSAWKKQPMVGNGVAPTSAMIYRRLMDFRRDKRFTNLMQSLVDLRNKRPIVIIQQMVLNDLFPPVSQGFQTLFTACREDGCQLVASVLVVFHMWQMLRQGLPPTCFSDPSLLFHKIW